jgi:hypothetical protein
MPVRVIEPPDVVRNAAAAHVHQLATPRGVFPALRDVVLEDLALVAPHRVFALGARDVLDGGLQRAVDAGWRYLVADRGRIVASEELGGERGETASLNSGPFVESTANAIDELERLPEVEQAEFELRLLKVPALYVVAAWLVGERSLLRPLAPLPSFLEAGRTYSEAEFVTALQAPAQRVLGFAEPSGG